MQFDRVGTGNVFDPGSGCSFHVTRVVVWGGALGVAPPGIRYVEDLVGPE